MEFNFDEEIFYQTGEKYPQTNNFLKILLFKEGC